MSKRLRRKIYHKHHRRQPPQPAELRPFPTATLGDHPEATEGYAKAEVTAGGVDTSERSTKTMESRKVSGLYFIGEVVDVTGQLGGFNFQWAWASGFYAGEAV
jgi:predicted flavoprotein YhiN